MDASPIGVAFVRTWLGRFAMSGDGEQWDKHAFMEALHYKVSPIRCASPRLRRVQPGSRFTLSAAVACGVYAPDKWLQSQHAVMKTCTPGSRSERARGGERTLPVPRLANRSQMVPQQMQRSDPACRWGALDEELFPDPCAYANPTKHAAEDALDPERDIAACADAFVARMTAMQAHNKVHSHLPTRGMIMLPRRAFACSCQISILSRNIEAASLWPCGRSTADDAHA